ncbi:MAG: glutamate decarboxylase [Clostridiales bacterium]|jgi:glutamate decarboxylase|nr:glutamate decarboxylase [Clostridiales bacterium]
MALYQRKDIRDNLEDSIFGSRDSEIRMPKYRFPKTESDPKVILEVLKDELFLDGNARQNLATFCQTFEEQEVHEIMDLSINKNMIDKDEYPQTAAIEERCVHMIADLWHAPESKNTVGTSTVGSSEACMLGGLAMYWRWREKREKEGKDTSRPNLVTGPVQVCWEKFCRYWDIELREVPMERESLAMTPGTMLEHIDENTIGVVATFGLTFTGKYEPVKALCDALDQLSGEKGIDLDLHVDAASGGFLAPFCAPDIPWDFQNPRVKSISASGHKFGLAPLGCGWVLWRDRGDLPKRLVFHVNYLGGDMAVFQLNFSRPAGQVISQYYEFLRLGYEGYRKIHMNCYRTAQYLAASIEKTGLFDILYDANPEKGIPALAWALKKDAKVNFNLYDFADKLRSRGWQVPAYSLPKDAQDVVVQRILVRQGFGLDMAELFMEDFRRTLTFFEGHEVVTPLTQREAGGFNHAG